MATEKQAREPRDVLTDTNVHMKCITFENKEGGYFIGNCNLSLGLKNTVLRFVPPDSDGRGAKVVIVNSTYNNEEFEQFLDEVGELEELPAYFHGLCNMDINAMQTVFKFFPERFGENNVLVIQQTQKRSEGKRIDNPLEVKIFMKQKSLRS
jgi:hypothetical protein